jgi:transposase-like protein
MAKLDWMAKLKAFIAKWLGKDDPSAVAHPCPKCKAESKKTAADDRMKFFTCTKCGYPWTQARTPGA